MLEYLILAVILGTAGYILFNSIRKKSKGGCCDSCGSCSSHCPLNTDDK